MPQAGVQCRGILLARGGEGTRNDLAHRQCEPAPCRDDQASHATRAANMPVSGSAMASPTKPVVAGGRTKSSAEATRDAANVSKTQPNWRRHRWLHGR